MSTQQERITAYENWVSATEVFQREIKSAVNGQEYDHELLRRHAKELQENFEEYRRIWEIL